MVRNLSRLFNPRSVCVIGGGAWCRAVVTQLVKMGFQGDIWPVHPQAATVAGVRAYASLAALPQPPDASFIGVNRHATVEIVRELETMNAGGAVCFASGFSEARDEDAKAAEIQEMLLLAAGDMPVLGPNCYGFINYLDGALLWPDQQGGARVDTGVAVVMQSSNIAINLTMQRRGLPLAYVVTAGNQAQTSFAEIGQTLLADDRVTALGLHIEGIRDLKDFENLARHAARLGKPIVALKMGASEQARAATLSHTASLAGSDAGAQALLDRFAIARVSSLSEFLETLKLLHVSGPLASNRIASISCSGGEASLVGDMATGRDLSFPALNGRQKQDLREALGPMVALANPLDYQTYIWRDVTAMTRAWGAMIDPSLALTMILVDFPRSDRCDAHDWECAIAAALNAKAASGGAVAMVSTLPELMPEDVAHRLMAGGVAPLCGLNAAMAAAEAAAICGQWGERLKDLPDLLVPGRERQAGLISEHEAKERLRGFGVVVPRARTAMTPQDAAMAAREIGFPVVLKGQGIAHKTEAGAVRLGLTTPDEVRDAAKSMKGAGFLVEAMVTGAIAELLIGVVRDAAHGYVLTIAAGGMLTELLQDQTSVLIPARRKDIETALNGLRISRILNGYRGAAKADKKAVVEAVIAVQNYVLAHADGLEEIEINPLICTRNQAVAADVLLRCEVT